MRTIISETFLRYENGKALVRAEIAADTAADLPAADAFPGSLLSMGSIAWVIAAGEFYALTSSGRWVYQGHDSSLFEGGEQNG